ncbi:Uncharacterised protein [Mycobacterium tuberculosis]|nr:Uncharacterised protein [Mycobacterium tuberculosis]
MRGAAEPPQRPTAPIPGSRRSLRDQQGRPSRPAAAPARTPLDVPPTPRTDRHSAARAPSATAGVDGPPTPSGRCWWRSDAARCVARTCPRSPHRPSRPAAASPEQGLPRRAASQSCDSSVRAVHAGRARCGRRSPRAVRRRARGQSFLRAHSRQ